jgi:hypothetical protein
MWILVRTDHPCLGVGCHRMIQSRDELIMEMAEEYGLDRMGEND